MLLWLVVADHFTARETRKLLPWMVVANGGGATVGALCVGPLARAFGVEAPLWSAAALLLLVAGGAHLLMSAPGERVAVQSTNHAKAPLWSGVAVLRARPLAAWLALLVAAAGVFGPIMYYVLSVTAAAEFTSEQELAAFFGRYRAFVQLAALLAQLVAAPWLSKRLGVGPLLLLAPIGAVIGALVVGASSALLLVAVSQAAIRVLDVAIQSPTEQLIQNLLPEELRGRVAGIVGGVAKRSGAIVGGLLASSLIVFPLAFLGALLASALCWLAIAFALWRRFPSLAVAELAGAVRGPSLEFVARLGDDRGLAQLRKSLVSESVREQESARALLRRLGRAQRADVLAELLEALCTGNDSAQAERVSVEVRRCLGDGLQVSPRAAAVAVELLTSQKARLCASTVLGCAENAQRYASELQGSEGEFRELALEVAIARATGGSVLAILCGSGHEAEVVDELRCEIGRAIRGASQDDPGELGERLLRSVAKLSEAERVVEALDSVVLAMQNAAPSALLVLMSSRLSGVAAQWRKSAEPALREASLVAMCAAGAVEYRSLVSALGDVEERVRRRAESLLRDADDAALEALSVASQSGRLRLRMAAVEMLAELRPSAQAFESLLERELEEMSRASRHAKACAHLRKGGLVRRRLQERAEEAALAALMALEAIGGTRGIGLVATRLRRAVSERSRARALEALDALLPRRIASAVLGALEGTLEAGVTEDEAIAAELAGSDSLTRDLLVHALGREGRARFRDSITEAAEVAGALADPVSLMQRLIGSADGTVGLAVPSLIETIVALSELSLFADLQAGQLEELASVVQWRHLEIGETLMSEGDRANSMYFVVTGRMHVVVNGNTVASLEPGEPVGELGLFSEDRRSASVVAASTATLGVVTREDIEDLIEEVPGIALRLCRAMSRRLAEANAR